MQFKVLVYTVPQAKVKQVKKKKKKETRFFDMFISNKRKLSYAINLLLVFK